MSLMERIPGCWIEQTVEFDRETLDGNTGFQLKIPYLEHAFGTKYFIIDRVTGSMMGIYDDKVEQIDLKGQLKPFNINQLDRVMHILGQRRLGLDTSSIQSDEIPEESWTGQSSNRMEYPSTPKQFNLFQEYKNVEHDGNMLTADQRTKVYEDRSKVIAEMAKVFHIFSRSIFFNPEMADQYNLSQDKYFNYFCSDRAEHRYLLTGRSTNAHKSRLFFGSCSRLPPQQQ